MANIFSEKIRERIKDFVTKYAKEYPKTNLAAHLSAIIEELSQELEGSDEHILQYMAEALSYERNQLPAIEASELETYQEIMDDFLKILETGDVNVIDYVRKQEAAIRYKVFLQQGIRLYRFSKEWASILEEIHNSLNESSYMTLVVHSHDCSKCPASETCSFKEIVQRLEEKSKASAGIPAE